MQVLHPVLLFFSRLPVYQHQLVLVPDSQVNESILYAGEKFSKKTWQRSQRSQSSQAADAQLPTQEQGVEQDAPVPQKMTKGAALKQGLPPENHGLHFWKSIFEMFTCTPIKKIFTSSISGTLPVSKNSSTTLVDQLNILQVQAILLNTPPIVQKNSRASTLETCEVYVLLQSCPFCAA